MPAAGGGCERPDARQRPELREVRDECSSGDSAGRLGYGRLIRWWQDEIEGTVTSAGVERAERGRTVAMDAGGTDAEPPGRTAPEVELFRKYTEELLRRFVRRSLEAGGAPSLLGREMFRGNVDDLLGDWRSTMW